jgi:hypothetical protein
MKSPSKSIAQSLRGQTPAGRHPGPVKVCRPTGKLSMIASGEGCVVPAPGMVDDRSAVHYADAMAKQTGGRR